MIEYAGRLPDLGDAHEMWERERDRRRRIVVNLKRRNRMSDELKPLYTDEQVGALLERCYELEGRYDGLLLTTLVVQMRDEYEAERRDAAAQRTATSGEYGTARQIAERIEKITVELESGEIERSDYRALKAAILSDADAIDAAALRTWPQPSDEAAEQLARAMWAEPGLQRETKRSWDEIAAAVLARLQPEGGE